MDIQPKAIKLLCFLRSISDCCFETCL